MWDLVGDSFIGWEKGAEVTTLSALSLLAPVLPSKIICAGRNYPAHAAEDDSSVPEEPLLFFKPPSSVIGPDNPIVLPSQSEWVEHEAELALVIGRRCRDVRAEHAWQHVLGVTCANDVTARDLQRREALWEPRCARREPSPPERQDSGLSARVSAAGTAPSHRRQHLQGHLLA